MKSVYIASEATQLNADAAASGRFSFIVSYTAIDFADSECRMSFSQSQQSHIRDAHAVVMYPWQRSCSQQERVQRFFHLLDAVQGIGAASVTAVIPCMPYRRQDAAQPGASHGLHVFARQLSSMGVRRVVTMDLHNPESTMFFSALGIKCVHIPFHALIPALPSPGSNAIVVSPDQGSAIRAAHYANKWGLPMVVAQKKRNSTDVSLHIEIDTWQPTNKAIIIDDEINTGTTICAVANQLAQHGIADIHAIVTHGIFAPGSIEYIDASPIQRVITSDSVPLLTQSFNTTTYERIPSWPLIAEELEW